MNRLYFAAMAALGLAVLGCQTQAPLPASQRVEPAAQAVGYGNVQIRVRWPQRLQAIPLSANSLVVSAFDTLGRKVDDVTLVRDGDPDSLSSATMRLRAGTYTIEARAYRQSMPTANDVPTAMGATSATIKTNLLTRLSLILSAQAPTFGAMSATAGAHGSQFTLDTVRFFGKAATASDVVEVWFGNTDRTRVPAAISWEPRRRTAPVTGYNHLIDAEQDMLRVTVPNGITGQPRVWLKVDGVEVFVGFFTVVDRLVFDPLSITRQVGEWYNAQPTLQSFSLQTTASLVYPMVTWRSSAPSVAWVSALGTVYAHRPGRATITAQSGIRSATFEVIVTDRHSTASFTVDVPTLNSGTVSVPLDIPAYSGIENGTVVH